MKYKLSGLVLAASLALASAAHAEETLRAIAALPQNNVITKSFMRYIDIVNENGKGVISIQFSGGPEAIPPTQQATALRNGVIDLQGGPAGYYAGTLPESDALTGSTVTAAEARENGAFDMLKTVWRKTLDAELLAWNGAGTQYYVYMGKEPTLNDAGDLDLSGTKLRSAGTYRDWFSSMGAKNVMMKQSEVFGALDRGIVDGFGWITFVSDIGVNRLIKARVGPAVWQGSPVIMINGARYDSLSDDAQQVLQDAAIELEKLIFEEMPASIANEEARLKADGVKLFELEGEAGQRHIDKAHGVLWSKLEKNSPEFAAKIKPLLYPGH